MSGRMDCELEATNGCFGRFLGRCSKPPVAQARAWVGISLGRTQRRGGGRSSGARARLVVKAVGGL
jgi:hypothetical protein